MLGKVKKDGLEKEADFFVKEACSVCVVCFEYLLNWAVSFNEFDCFHGINLNEALSFSEVQSTVKYLREEDMIVDDIECVDQLWSLKTLCNC
jgi:hypothetical protein